MIGRKAIRGIDPSGKRIVIVNIDATGIIVEVRHEPVPASTKLPILAPGLIDAQVNGYDGADVNASDVSPDVIVGITEKLAGIGVTTWVPTIVTACEEAICYALQQIRLARNADRSVAAAIPSVAVEGPFISDRDGPRGVHDAAQVRPIDLAEVQRWQRHGNLVGTVTVSPHHANSAERIQQLGALGIQIAIGHTHANVDQVQAAIDAGARIATHLGNGIDTTLPRHPNLLWTQLADDRLIAGLIADGHHLPADTLEVMLRAKTVHRAYLVSDMTALAGRAPGRYTTPVGGEVELSADGRISYLGTQLLAGAARTLPEGLNHVTAVTSLNLDQALTLVTATPAAHIPRTRPGLAQIRPGAPADLVLLESLDGGGVRVAAAVQSGRTVLGSLP